MSWAFLQNIWFLLIGVLLIGYSILDGFDLGIGTLLPFLAKKEEEKRVLFNAVGPFWDGNEVWLLTGGGALFAAFPHAYATVFSGFYLALMLVLFALIFRAVSLEFRAHDDKRKGLWEWAFIIGSFLPSLLFGVALGNVVVGIPLDARMEFTGNFFTLLKPFPLAVGLLGLFAILIQGSTYAILKTNGDLKERAKALTKKLLAIFIILLVLTFILTIVYLPHALSRVLAWIFAVVVIASWIGIGSAIKRGTDSLPFYLSSLMFISLWGIVGSIHYPNLVRASNDPSYSLTIYNASSSQLTLTVMLIIALIGMPIVIFYTAYVYKVFKGKIRPADLGEEGY